MVVWFNEAGRGQGGGKNSVTSCSGTHHNLFLASQPSSIFWGRRITSVGGRRWVQKNTRKCLVTSGLILKPPRAYGNGLTFAQWSGRSDCLPETQDAINTCKLQTAIYRVQTLLRMRSSENQQKLVFPHFSGFFPEVALGLWFPSLIDHLGRMRLHVFGWIHIYTYI